MNSPQETSYLPNRLRTRRKELGLTQVELSDIAGVSPRFIHDLENGKGGVRMDLVLAVADALGLRVELRLLDPTGSGAEARTTS
ncbi:MAG TPA: helix-turn-helix transcriptional regulator [Trueperaceae bacterium]|nr:helix-turn-helix transcriptional regulator [Trueperaceae bacterium]